MFFTNRGNKEKATSALAGKPDEINVIHSCPNNGSGPGEIKFVKTIEKWRNKFANKKSYSILKKR